MSLSNKVLVLGGLLGLAACTPLPDDRPYRPGECQAASYQHLVGGPVAAFNAQRPTGLVRVLAPNSVMTMDHHPSRLNVYHNRAGTITRIACG